MSSKRILEALSRRVDFAYEVGERLGHAFDHFLLSSHGRGYEWTDPRTPTKFGCAAGSICSVVNSQAEEKSQIGIKILPTGKATVGIAEWTMNDCGNWEGQDDISVELLLDQENDVDDTVALILAEVMLEGTDFSRCLRSYVEEQLSLKPSSDAFPSPNR